MKIVEQYVFEVGDVFTGKGDGCWLVPNQRRLLSAPDHYLFVKEVGINAVYLCGVGYAYNFSPEELTDHIKKDNLIYLGNVYKGKDHD
ncbi:hypothetical protein EPNKCIFM_00117 [Klebsiella phage KP13-16]|nr:hypothetical protein EPNKCIFM_00117 [Klebsiella phage KP13-16]HBT0444730.1 hypothetical protein [Klebsiella pneumoniae]